MRTRITTPKVSALCKNPIVTVVNMLILIMTRHRLGFIIWGEYVEKSKVGHGLQTERTERKKKRKLKEKAEEKNKKKTKKNAK